MTKSVTANAGLDKYLQRRPTTRTAAPADARMAQAQRWTVWTLRRAEGQRKPSKIPVANPTDPSTWSYYHAMRSMLDDPKVAGLGFEMYGRSGILGLDLDNCIDEAGTHDQKAKQLLAILEAAGGKFHVEISPSGKGLRIFAAETPLPFHDFTNKDTGVEVYSGESGRFLAFTGAQVPGFEGGPFDALPQAAVEWLGRHASKWKAGAARQGDGLAESGDQGVVRGPPLPDLDRRDDWQKLHSKALRKIGKDHNKFIEDGVIADRYASASEQLFAAEQALLKHLKPAQAYQILISAEGSWTVALEHRENDSTKAREFIWSDLLRAAAGREKREADRASATSGWKECDIRVEVVDDQARAKFLQLNIINAFQKHPEWFNRLAYNTFDGRVTIDRREMTVRDLAEASAWLCEFLKWQFEPKREVFEEAITEAARTRPWNPIAEELRALSWDGEERWERLAAAVCMDPHPLDEELMKRFLVGYVARGLEPGCDMHSILSLSERKGGGFKTKFCRLLARSQDRYSDSPGFGGDKDSSMLRVGMRVIELGEAIAARRGDRFDLKRDITKVDDHFRPPWGRTTERRKRGFVYVLTANDTAFLRSDQDGLRRIWPVDARGVIDIRWVAENMDQLLAHAVALFDRGEQWWWDKGDEPEELIERQGTAVQEDPYDAAVQAVATDKENQERGYTTLSEVTNHVQAVVGHTLNSHNVQHLIDILLKNDFTSTQRRIDGRKMRIWRHESWVKISGDWEAEVVDIGSKRRSEPLE